MIVDQPDCLHVAIDHGGSDEAESSPLQIVAERVGLAGRGGNLPHGTSIDSVAGGRRRIASNMRRSRRVLPAPAETLARYSPQRRFSSGSGWSQDRRFACRSEPRSIARPLCIEVAERASMAVALVEHDRPAESRLRAFENQ